MVKDRTFTLSNGVEITFRIVRPDDARALQRVHARCSERTIYMRFFGSLEISLRRTARALPEVPRRSAPIRPRRRQQS